MAAPIINKVIDVIAKYQAEVSANPNSVESQTGLGWGYYGKRQYPEAAKAFEAALAGDGNNLEARYGLALTYKASGARTNAVTEFERAAALVEKVEDSVRQHMLQRQIKGHISMLNTGDWNLGKKLGHA